MPSSDEQKGWKIRGGMGDGKQEERWRKRKMRSEVRRGQTMNTIGKGGGERVKEIKRRMRR